MCGGGSAGGGARQVESFLLRGQLQRLPSIGTTRVPVMCGAMDVWCNEPGRKTFSRLFKRLRSMTQCFA